MQILPFESKVNTITKCEVCGNDALESVLNLGLHPMCDDLIKVGDDAICRDYPIEILYCRNCRTAHQKYQVPKHDLFPVSYHYRARFTSDVLKGMKGLVNSCEQQFGSLHEKKVLDVGCNDGSLLNFFRDRGAQTIGIEPTGASDDAIANGHFVISDFLTEKTAMKVVEKYGQKFGGVFIWEYFDIKPNALSWIRNIQEIYSISSLNDSKCNVS